MSVSFVHERHMEKFIVKFYKQICMCMNVIINNKILILYSYHILYSKILSYPQMFSGSQNNAVSSIILYIMIYLNNI